jgi:hypothetical protein
MKIKPILLKSYYLIIPVSILIVMFDKLIFSSTLQNKLPKSPNEFYLFTLFFVLPHIIASLLTFAEKSYLSYYRKSLMQYTFLALLGTIIFIYALPQNIYLALFGLITLYHVIGQQFGLNAAFANLRDNNFSAWKYLGFIIAALSSVLLFFPSGKNALVFNSIILSILFLLLAFAYLTYRCLQLSQSKFGREYFVLNFLLIVFVFIFIAIDYSFFAILLPRFVHDLTAFNFYSVHNYNRVHSGNKLHLNSVKYSVFWTLLVAIIIAQGISFLNISFVILFLTLLHYGVERFIWKGATLHKEFIKF